LADEGHDYSSTCGEIVGMVRT